MARVFGDKLAPYIKQDVPSLQENIQKDKSLGFGE